MTATAGGCGVDSPEVRLRKIAEAAPPEAIAANPAWARNLEDTAPPGRCGCRALSPARCLRPSPPPVRCTEARSESTLLALGNTFHHGGGIIVPPGYPDPVQFQSGNPWGTSHVAGDGPPGEVSLEAARHQARRVADTAAALKAGRAA